MSARLDKLSELVRRLADENRSLRQGQEQLAAERAQLLNKNELARSRVEAMRHGAAIGVHALHFAVEDVDGVVVEVAGVEDVLVAPVFGDRGLGPQLLARLRTQGVQREQLGEFGGGYGHCGAPSFPGASLTP